MFFISSSATHDRLAAFPLALGKTLPTVGTPAVVNIQRTKTGGRPKYAAVRGRRPLYTGQPEVVVPPTLLKVARELADVSARRAARRTARG